MTFNQFKRDKDIQAGCIFYAAYFRLRSCWYPNPKRRTRRMGNAMLITCQRVRCSFTFLLLSKRNTMSLLRVAMIEGLFTRYSTQLSRNSLFVTGMKYFPASVWFWYSLNVYLFHPMGNGPSGVRSF